jgi:hypothetical protein
LAEYRAQICLLGLKELQKSWDISDWVLQLFFRILDESTAKKLRSPEDDSSTGPEDVNPSSASSQPSQEATVQIPDRVQNWRHLLDNSTIPENPRCGVEMFEADIMLPRQIFHDGDEQSRFTARSQLKDVSTDDLSGMLLGYPDSILDGMSAVDIDFLAKCL